MLFYSQFSTLIDSNDQLTPVQKLLYLQTSLSERASAIISHLPLSEANYPVAITLLKQRYDNPRRLVMHHCAALSECPSIRGYSLKDIRSFIDTYNVHFQALSSIQGINVYESVFVAQMLSRLDQPLRAKFEESHGSSTFPTAKELLEFLSEQAVQLENVELSKPRQAAAVRVTVSTPRQAHKALSLVTALSSCAICHRNTHRIYTCPSFTK